MAQLTPTQALEHAREWLAAEDGMSAADDGTITVDGNPPLSLALTTDDERVVIRHTHEERGAGAGRADAVMAAMPDRGTMLHVSAAVAKTGVTFTFTNPVYLDGFSRHALMTAIHELVAAIDRVGGATSVETRVQPAVVADVTPAPASAPVTPVETDTAEVDPVAAAWSPTHRVPAGGMRAWNDPDPAAQPASRLEARVELTVAERRGDWARVVGVNGWTGWVDARKLEAVRPTGTSGIELGNLSIRPLPAAGAVILLLAAFLPWVSGQGASLSAFDLALSSLWSDVAVGTPYLGWLILAFVAAAVFLAATAPRPGVSSLLGTLSVATGAVFAVQLYRGASDSGATIGQVFDLVGLAVWAMIAAGAVLLASARRT